MISLQTTNIPLIQWTPQGLIIPTLADILAGVQADWLAAFGSNLNLAPTTRQGQLMATTAAQIAACYALIAYVVNQIDPAQAEGFMQDAISQLYGLLRLPATFTSVTATLSGRPNLTIYAGYLAQNKTTGDIYELTENVTTDPSTGNVDGTFQCTVAGPIACAPGALNGLYQGQSGLTGITNAAAGIPGTDLESREALEIRRQNTLAANGNGNNAALYSQISKIAGVKSVYVIDNPTALTVTIGPTNYPLVRNSVYVGVAGSPAPADIGAAMNLKKGGGCGMNGNTNVTVIDPITGVSGIYTYNQVTDTPVYYNISIQNGLSIPSNIVALVQTAVVAQATGADGTSTPYGIANEILAFDMSDALRVLGGVKIPVLTIQVSLTAGSGFTSFVQMGIDQMPVFDPSYVTVTLA